MNPSDNFFQSRLEKLEQNDLQRELRHASSPAGSRFHWQGRELVNFSSNSYLGLNLHPKIQDAAAQAACSLGVGSGSSRLVCGAYKMQQELELLTAKWKKKESCLLLNSGFQANASLIPALIGRGEQIFADKLIHASLIDGVRLSGAEFHRFVHNDLQALEHLLKKKRHPEKRALLIVESIYSMDGDSPDFHELLRLKKLYDLELYIDDAHGSGTCGAEGSGPVAEFAQDVDYWMGTYSKALGSFGAWFCSSKVVYDYLINTCRSLIFSTSLPPSIIASNIAAIKLLQSEEGQLLINKLQNNCMFFHNKASDIGLEIPFHTSPIFPLICGTEQRTLDLQKNLQYDGFFVGAIRPPTVPINSSRLRITLSAIHCEAQLDQLISCLDNHFTHKY